jgi:hypothetical protein
VLGYVIKNKLKNNLLMFNLILLKEYKPNPKNKKVKG